VGGGGLKDRMKEREGVRGNRRFPLYIETI